MISQSSLVEKIYATRDEVLGAIEGADLEKVVYAKGSWRLHEILCHIVGWHNEAVLCIEAHSRNEQYKADFDDGDEFNNQMIEERKGLSLVQIIDDWSKSHAGLAQAVENLSVEQYAKGMMYPWGAVNTVEYFINHMMEHEVEHIKDVMEK